VLWSVAISSFNPQDPVDGLVQAVVPGTIILMHDVGDPQRLPGLRRLGDIITGLRDRGFRLVTVSELLSAQSAAV
jgi:peptidoglycan/xylan/chitin deacetylase (PgdA/CDA1 family)